MVRRHYKVLAQVSLSYSQPKGRFPRVTHPCATKPEGFVRLACVRHAASVRSEPGSNSQVCVTIFTAPGKKPSQPQTPNFREPIPALVKRNGYEGHIRHRLINRLPEPKDPRTGRRRPHVPSSKTNNVKEPPKQTAGQPSFPGFYLGGLVARLCRRPVKSHSVAASPSGEAAYMDHSRVGQTLFSKNFHIPNQHTTKPQFAAIPTP